MIFAADLEATTDPDDCRVWEWRFEDLNSDYSKEGLTLSELFTAIIHEPGSTFYFHNLRYDGTFILTELLSEGYTPYIERDTSDNKKRRRKVPTGQFSTLITDDLKYYQIIIGVKGQQQVTVRDSYKLIPLSEAMISKKFGLSTSKGEIDYDKPRPVGYLPSLDEWEYLRDDVTILKSALLSMFQLSIDKLTIGASALANFKRDFTHKEWDTLFPKLKAQDRYLRPAYRGGYCIANPLYQGKEVGAGYVMDKNSMYPGVMAECPLPYGEPVRFIGEYEPDEEYPLYICKIEAWLDLKEGHLPTVQIKKHAFFKPEEYICHTDDEPVIITCTGQDLERIKEHYDCEINYIDGYKFRASTKIFRPYVERWYSVKEGAQKSGDAALRQIAKLMENSLYGKFGVRLSVREKVPYLSGGKILHRYPEQEIEAREGPEAAEEYLKAADFTRDPVYLPVSIFVTSWARYEITGLAQQHYESFLYCDTDSLHILGDEDIQGIRIHESALGAWAKEAEFTRGKYLRAKAYIEEIESEDGVSLSVHCAGMPKGCHQYVTFENFNVGTTYEGKLLHRNVIGGQVLLPTTFTIKS